MTREEDLVRIAKKLDKMVSRNNTEGALDLLKELKGFNMTLKLLQDTRIGMSVNGIRKHCTDEEVITLAKILIKNWKKLLESTHSQKTDRPGDKNRRDPSKATAGKDEGLVLRPSSEKKLSHRKLSAETKPMSNTEKKQMGENRREQTDEHMKKYKHVGKHKKNHERKKVPDPSVPIPPLPVHSPNSPKRPSAEHKKERKIALDPNLPVPPLALHLHPLPLPRRPSVASKNERKNSPDSKVLPPKRPSQDARKDRKESMDSKTAQAMKRHVTECKSERRDSQDPQSLNAGLLQPKPSTDSRDRGNCKSKPETPRTPTSPTSPISPSFNPTGGILPSHLLTGDSVRDKCIEMLATALRTNDDYMDFGTNCDSMAAEIEDHIYQEMRSTDMKYKNRVRSRISNLKDPKNPGLRKNVLAGVIELCRIASMTAEEMASDELKQLRNVLTQEAIREHQMAKTGGTTTDLLQCAKCKKKNCTYNQVQTRSADEPMTTFVLCNECGNRWKVRP
ncbi:transcription elongation factor A protein 3 isoform X3 [Scleropages formosus]|uniref:transcription elongation factor A protein 3 isoform X3 n=1 Tax=Scleropages formosus TaxID=113540 RepID=UPI0008789DA7|nr:transcription elongation factor A protein 3-like isoform X3 [Scleropages formosus]